MSDLCNTCGGPKYLRKFRRVFRGKLYNRRYWFCPACYATGGHLTPVSTEATNSSTKCEDVARSGNWDRSVGVCVEINRLMQSIEQRLRVPIVEYWINQIVGEHREGERRKNAHSTTDRASSPATHDTGRNETTRQGESG
jgi:hypothetical protein